MNCSKEISISPFGFIFFLRIFCLFGFVSFSPDRSLAFVVADLRNFCANSVHFAHLWLRRSLLIVPLTCADEFSHHPSPFTWDCYVFPSSPYDLRAECSFLLIFQISFCVPSILLTKCFGVTQVVLGALLTQIRISFFLWLPNPEEYGSSSISFLSGCCWWIIFKNYYFIRCGKKFLWSCFTLLSLGGSWVLQQA